MVEIYTSLAAVAAGLSKGRTKVRDATTLDRALGALGSVPHAPLARYHDHATDALITAAWLRSAHADPARTWTSGDRRQESGCQMFCVSSRH